MTNFSPLLQKAIQMQEEGRLEEASGCYREILEQDPYHGDANHLLGLVAHQQGNDESALHFVNIAIKVHPDIAMYHANRGRILQANGSNLEAVSAYSSALRLKPGDGNTLSDLAGALLANGDLKQAELFVNRALELAPNLAVAHYNKGLIKKLLGQNELAYLSFEKALELEPSLANALFELGRLYQLDNDNENAKNAYREALAANPVLFEAHVNLGNIFRNSFELEEAISQYRAAIMINPNQAVAHGNLGVALQEIGQAEAALEAYDRSIRLDNNNPETHRNRAQLLLQMGRFIEGWQAFEWRWKTEHFAAIRREWQCPQWKGQLIEEAVVLVHAEQGFGDTIQFARYLPLVASRVGTLLVECPRQLLNLIESIPEVDYVIATGNPLPDCDFHVPMMSLPGVFGTIRETIPSQVPYLKISSTLWKVWKGRVQGNGLFKVGIVWKGSHQHLRNTWRSPGITALRPLFDIPGIQWVSLQKEDEFKDLKILGMEKSFVQLGKELRDFADTAAVIKHLDLILCPDTAVAHLAGALKCPVWLILPYVAEWRWLANCSDSPWYPSMRLFRQEIRQDWSRPVERIARELQALVA